MSEFTKGTWEAGIDTSSMLPYIWTKLKNIPAKIAVMHRCPYIKDKEQLANARLIAAAPEMYKLLEEANQIFYLCRRTNNDEDERRSVIDEINERYKDFEIHSMNLLARIDGEEAKHEQA